MQLAALDYGALARRLGQMGQVPLPQPRPRPFHPRPMPMPTRRVGPFPMLRPVPGWLGGLREMGPARALPFRPQAVRPQALPFRPQAVRPQAVPVRPQAVRPQAVRPQAVQQGPAAVDPQFVPTIGAGVGDALGRARDATSEGLQSAVNAAREAIAQSEWPGWWWEE
jgi:hypothetical protein